MADTIVKSFVIDTSKAEQNLRSLDAASAATQASLDLLYNQLVQLDQQLNGLDPSSEAFANVNTQIQALETTISNIETGGIQNIGNAIDDIDTAKVKNVGDAIQSIDTGDAARNIENIGDAIEKVVAPVDQLSSATGQLNTELKDIPKDVVPDDIIPPDLIPPEVIENTKSLKAQLRELQAELANVDPNTDKYVELSQAASELKDKIGDAARNIESVGDAIEQVVAPVDQLANATGELNTELKDTKVDTSNLDAAAGEYKDLAVSQDEVVTSSKSLKAQLRELQVQLANTEPDSQAYVELASQASILKDKISDAAEAVGTQAGSAFERVGNSLGLVTGRIANLDFEGAAEGAKLLAQNITNIKPGDIAKGIQGIGSAFASIGKALLTNPIFLIGAAIAAAIVYADELLSLIDGVTDAEQESLNVQKERAAVAKQNFDNISATEETLKRQGLTEEQITQLKITQLNTAIAEQQAVIETTRIQAEGQIKAAERNAQYLKTFLDFVTLPTRKIAEFFQGFVNGSIEVLNKLGLGIEKIDVTKVFEDVNNFVVKQIFDPEEERKNQEKIVADAEKSLQTLTNQRDGILNAQDAKEKAARAKAASDAKTAEEKAAADLAAIRDKELADELKRIDELAAARKKANEDRIATEDAQFALRQELTLTDQQKEIQAAVKLSEDRLKVAGDDAALQKLVTDQREKDIADIIAKYKGQTTTSNAQSNSQQLQDDQNLYAAKLQAVSDSFGAIASLATAFGKSDEARAKKAFKIQKAASIAQATVDTYKGAQGVFANAAINPATVLFPAQPYIQAALAVAAGLVNVKNIASQQFQSTTPPSNDSPPPPSVGGGGNESQPAQFNPLAAQFIQNQPEQITPRAFVLAGDVSSQQEVREKVQDLARLG